MENDKNDIGLLVKYIPKDQIDLFMKKTSSSLNARKEVHKISIDYSWIEILCETVPYLDEIVRNPRRFIIQEEDILPVEKTKMISKATIKHLSTHTQYIRDIDEDDEIKPGKLLNLLKEETMDIYENRFIFTLLKKLYHFIHYELECQEKAKNNKEEKRLTYEAVTTNYNQEDVNINISLVAKGRNEEELTEEELKERTQKIDYLVNVLDGFMGSKFMKDMKNALEVSSPIKRTNLILRETNFRKALDLWDYLEKYQIETPIEMIDIDEEITYDNLEHNIGLTYCIDYNLLKNEIKEEAVNKIAYGTDIYGMIFEYAKKFTVDNEMLKKQIDKQLKLADKYKKDQIAGIKNACKAFIDNNESRMKKAILLLK